jgi:hypothetical protein
VERDALAEDPRGPVARTLQAVQVALDGAPEHPYDAIGLVPVG